MGRGPLRVALVGVGNHSRKHHAATLQRYQRERPDEVALVAACDLDVERAATAVREFGFGRAYADVDEMMRREQPDACVAVMPVGRIVPLALDLLRYRTPLMVEKPPGTTPDECRRLIDAAAAADVPIQVSVNRRHHPLLTRGLAWAREQGEVRFVSGAMLRARRREAEFISGTGIHIIDALRHLAGDVESYTLRGGRGKQHGQRWFAADLEFAGGLPGFLLIDPDCGMVAERYRLHGEGFSVEVQMGPLCPYELRCRRDNKAEIDESLPADAPPETAQGAYEETCAFIAAVRDGRRPYPTPEDVLPSMVLARRFEEELA